MFRSFVGFAVAFVTCTVSLRAQQTAPLTSVEEIANHAGRTAIVEFTVVEVKYPQRREAVFLTSTANFRSPQSFSIMIRDADLPHFSANGVKGVSAKYTGKHIRVRGEIARDEGQLVVRITSPEQLEVVKPVAKPASGNEIVVSNENRKARRVSAEELAKLPQEQFQVEHEGKKQTYSGVSLAAVLRHAGIILGEKARGPYVNRYVIVSASDGYRALFSVGEIDPYLSNQTVLVADKCDGKPLPATEGPWRLIVSGDMRHRRWVRSTARIEIRYAQAEDVPSTKN
jgi:hypothetical protein